MSNHPIYVLDASVFIEAKKRYYAFDIAPPFWDALVNQASRGRLLSIDRVKDEIERGNDVLVDWANGQFHNWFASTAQDDVIKAYRDIITWVNNQSQFAGAAKAEFADEKNADGWVIAYAQAKRCVVVTEEKFNPDRKKKVLIPNGCREFSVECIDTFGMLRDMGVRFTEWTILR